MQNSLFDHFYNIGVIPVLEIDRGADAVPLAQALLAGGLPIAEVTLRTGAALEAIERIAEMSRELLSARGRSSIRSKPGRRARRVRVSWSRPAWWRESSCGHRKARCRSSPVQ